MSELIAEIKKNARETLKFELSSYNGHELAAFRVWVHADDGEDKPTKKGLTVRRELLPEMQKAFNALCKAARKHRRKEVIV